MDTGSPRPVVTATDNGLSLTYFGPDDEQFQITFIRPRVHYFGPPNDEALEGHPMAAFGLGYYSAFEVRNSRWVEELCKMNRVHPNHSDALFDGLRHFIWTFPDSTFECLAEGFAVGESRDL